MRKRWTFLAVLGAMVAGSPALASVSVTNYSWLQLEGSKVTITPFGAGGTVTGFGNPQSPRWGDWLWIPHHGLTGSGTATWGTTLEFDTPRPVTTVDTTFWAREGTSLTRFYVDGSTNGTTWSNIGDSSSASPQTGLEFRRSVDVTDGTYKAIRVRFEPGD